MKKLILGLIGSLFISSPAMASGLDDLRYELQILHRDAAAHQEKIDQIARDMSDDEVRQVQEAQLKEGVSLGDAVVEVYKQLNFIEFATGVADEAFPSQGMSKQ